MMEKTVRRRKNEKDMTTGSIAKNLISFALPLLAGNMFQQLYNMVDTWVIGQTHENGAYAAVGSVGPIINILIGFFMGLSTGAGVVISQYFGAKREDMVRKAVHTALLLTVAMGVLFTLLGVLLTPWILTLMLRANEDANTVFPYAKTYLVIYFSGIMALMIYNMGSGILRAVGDSRRPFYFLVVCAVINTALDLVFVFWLHMGVAGVAYATVIAQVVSAVLTVIVLLRTDSCVRLIVRELKMDWEMLGRIVKIGIPAALQMALTAFSNVFVQSYIANVNLDQTCALGAWTTYSKMDQIIFLPLQSLALSVTTFVGQNLGVGDIRRAKRGTYIAYGIATGATVVLIAVIMGFAPTLSAVFNSDPQVVKYSTLLLRRITPFYLFSCVNQVFSGSLRGAGNSRAPMVIMLSTFVGFRQLYLFVMSTFISNDLLPIALGYPVGWIACAVVTLIYCYRFKFDRIHLSL